MGLYTNIIKELEDRLRAAQEPGRKLERVKKVLVGTRSKIEGLVDLPVVMITWDDLVSGNFLGEEVAANNMIVESLSLILTIRDGLKNGQADNILFDYQETTGILYLIEDVLDTLYNNVDGVLEPHLNNRIIAKMRLDDFSLGKIPDNDKQVEATIRLSMVCKLFTLNSRGSS